MSIPKSSSSFKTTKAQRPHSELKSRIDEIYKLDGENLKVLENLKKEVGEKMKIPSKPMAAITPRHERLNRIVRSQLANVDAIDVGNFRQRQKLFDTVQLLEKANAEKMDDIQEAIRLSMERSNQMRDKNLKQFQECEEKFESLHRKSMDMGNLKNKERGMGRKDG